MKTPIFSVIIPAHNEEKYIGKCLEAIKNLGITLSQQAN